MKTVLCFIVYGAGVALGTARLLAGGWR